MASLRAFGSKMIRGADALPARMSRLKRRFALAIDRRLIFNTPVDRGIARSNWIVSIGAPVEFSRLAFAPGFQLGVNESANATAAFNDALAVLSRNIPDGVPVFIVNNVSYIGVLNNGSSQQAPANFVQISIMGGISAVRQSGDCKFIVR